MTSSIRIPIRITKILFHCTILRYLNYLKGDKNSFLVEERFIWWKVFRLMFNSQGYGKNHKSIRKTKICRNIKFLSTSFSLWQWLRSLNFHTLQLLLSLQKYTCVLGRLFFLPKKIMYQFDWSNGTHFPANTHSYLAL